MDKHRLAAPTTFRPTTTFRVTTLLRVEQGWEYHDGVWSQKDTARLNLILGDYWSSSTQTIYTENAWVLQLYDAWSEPYHKTNEARVLCVR